VGKDGFCQLYEQELRELREERLGALELPKEQSRASTVPFFPVQDESRDFQRWRKRFVVPQPQLGLCSVLVPVFLGNLKNDEAIALALFLEPFGKDVLRATLGQNLRLRNIPERYLSNVYSVVKNVSELASAPALLANSISCTGADTCKLGICLSKGALRAISTGLAESALDLDQIPEFKLHLSGCPNTCGQHMLADLGFYGQVGRKNQRIFAAYGVSICSGGVIMLQSLQKLIRRPNLVGCRRCRWLVPTLLENGLDPSLLASQPIPSSP